jgi:amino-acid N-acetyltransferase
MITYSVSAQEDLPAIVELLSENLLPSIDIHHHLANFIVAKSDGHIIGTIGVEKHGNEGLLRSLAVSSDFRNQKIGQELYQRLTLLAAENDIKRFHLLTTTAEKYFSRLDFKMKDRNEAPEEIKNTLEFSSLCPASSTYMVKII